MTHLEVEVISQEIIKPSSPTPSHLRHYQYSFIDQTTCPKMYTSLLLFYEANGEKQSDITEISNHLKKSLAEVLALYYPLAGRARDDLYIDCNDEGVPYLEAQVNNCKLSDVLRNPISGELTKLLPFQVDDVHNDMPFGVQLNVFECGGFAIGQCVSHKIADGLSTLMFSRAWAATARRALGDQQAEIHRPEFVSATLFPPRQFAETSLCFAKKGLMSKTFVFDVPSIKHLRAKYAGLELPTRIETLTAFIWSRLVAVTNKDHDHKLHNVCLAVNLRPRFDPPLPPHTYGNIISLANSTPSLSNTREECHGLARQLRESIRKVDMSYIKKLQEGHDGDQGSGDGNDGQGSSEGSVISVFTSLCNYPLYDNDFGWGKPSWATVKVPELDLNNVVIFTDTRDGNGIEASITSSAEVMAKLESDTEFLQRVRTPAQWVQCWP